MRLRVSVTSVLAALLVSGASQAGEDPGLPDAFRAGGDYLVGSWNGEGTANGQPATMRLSVRWARGNQHQLYEWTTTSGETRVFGNAIGGLDRTRNRWVEYFMESDGNHWTNWWLDAPEGDVANTLYYGEQTLQRNGKEVKAKLTVERRGANEWSYTVEIVEGTPEVLLSMTFKRDTEAKKPPRKRPSS